MKVPINYFDPSNGQAMGLEQRIAELFKTESRIEIPELHESFNDSQKKLLMSEVTMWYEGKKLLTKVQLISQDYSDESTFLNEIENAFKHFVAPIIVTFSTRDSFLRFIEMLKGLNLPKKNAIQCSSFPCKVNGHGLFLNLKKDEVERYGNDFFPMSFQFRTIEDVYNLSFLFLWASPINKPKQETLKEIDPENIDGVKSGNTVNRKASTIYKKYIWVLFIAVGAIVGISVYCSEFSSKKMKGKVDIPLIQNNAIEKSDAHMQISDSKIKERVTGKHFSCDKFDSDKTMNRLHLYFRKGGKGEFILELAGGRVYGQKIAHRETFSWKVSNGEIYVTDSYGDTDVFTFKSGTFCDYIYNNGDEYK